MAVDKLVDSTQLNSDLTSVANAIRTKGGTSAQLAFPDGFVSAIGDIQTGGAGDYTANDFLDASKPVGEVSHDLSTLPTYPPSLSNRTGITKISLPNFSGVLPSNVFNRIVNMTEFSAPGVTDFNNNALAYCSKLEYIVSPACGKVRQASFGNCTSLKGADFGGEANGGFSAGTVFTDDVALKYVVIRSQTAWPLNNINDFYNTPFASGGSGGTLYVPASLISTYQGASNWSTILGYTNNQIKSIESTASDPDAPVDLTTHYIDGSLIPTP